MSPNLITPIPAFADASAGLWALLGAGLVITTVLGFWAGTCHAKSSAHRSLVRAKSTLAGLFGQVVTSIDAAQNACGLLETFSGLKLTLAQIDRLGDKQTQLAETLNRIVERQQLAAASPEPEAVLVPEINWVRTPQNSVTKLPDRSAFDENKRLLSRIAAEAGFPCGLLLVEIDRPDHLKTRFGIAGVQSFTRTMCGLICRSIRDADLVCQFNPEIFGVLLPGAGESIAQSVAEEVRRTIQRQIFRVTEKGAEVLVTASFGLSVFSGEADAELAVGRAENALKLSRKQGRNKLCFDSGHEVLPCAAIA